MIQQGLAPIVLLLNNSSYGMLEAIDRSRDYYSRPSWDYAAMARGARGVCRTRDDPGRAGRGHGPRKACPGAFLIESVTARDDLSPVMARIRTLLHMHQRPPPIEDSAPCRRPWLEAVILRGVFISIGAGVVRDVLDGNDRLQLAAARVGHGQLPQGRRIKVSENVIGGGRQNQPRPFRQLILKLARTPTRVTQKEDDSSLVGGGQRLHGVQLGGDIDLVRDHQVGHRPAVVQGHQRAAHWSAMAHSFGTLAGRLADLAPDIFQQHVQLSVEYQAQGSVGTMDGNQDHCLREVGISQCRRSDQQLPL